VKNVGNLNCLLHRYNPKTEKVARKALHDVHARASFELLSDVLLVTEAIMSTDDMSSTGDTDGTGPMGISMATTTPAPSLTKSTLTNASFKAKKLPGGCDR
jgi:hypothetical protein